MRQLVNVAYVAQVEHMDENEFRHFQRELKASPGRKVSRGTDALMRVMALQSAPVKG